MGASASFLQQPSPGLSVVDSFPRLGISVRFLQDFILRCGGHARLQHLTSQQVCQQFILKHTTRKKDSYVDWMVERREVDVGYAQVFVIHSWAGNFLTLVETLEHHFRHQPNILIWLDLFSMNQHHQHAIIYDEYWWRSLYKYGIQQIGYSVLVKPTMLHEQNNLQGVLNQTWSLYEIYMSLETDMKFEIAYRKRDVQHMLKGVLVSGWRGLLDRCLPWGVIDVQRSICSKESDKMNVINALNQTIDFQELNDVLSHRLRRHIVQCLQQAVAQRVVPLSKVEEATILFQLAKMYQVEDYWQDAEELFSQCLEMRMVQLGELHRDTLQVQNALAALHDDSGDFTKAEALYQHVLQQQILVHGKYHRNTIIAMCNVAMVYGHQDHLPDAKLWLEHGLQLALKYLPRHDTSFLNIGLNLACIYERLCLYEQAESMYSFCLEKEGIPAEIKEEDDWKYPLTHVGFYQFQDQLQHAEKLYSQSLQQCVEQLGAQHPHVAICLNNLAHLYESEGKLTDAISLYSQCLSVRKTSLGVAHPFTSITMSDLASVYLKQGQYKEAESLYQDCYRQRKQSLGANHPYTLCSQESVRSCQRLARNSTLSGRSHKLSSLSATATTASLSSTST